MLPYDGPAAAIDSLIQSAVDAGKMQLPSGTLGVFQFALTRLVAIQLGVPAEQRPFADSYAKINIKNERSLILKQMQQWRKCVESLGAEMEALYASKEACCCSAKECAVTAHHRR